MTSPRQPDPSHVSLGILLAAIFLLSVPVLLVRTCVTPDDDALHACKEACGGHMSSFTPSHFGGTTLECRCAPSVEKDGGAP